MMSYQNHGFADPWTNLWTNVYYKCRNNWNERCCLGTFFFQVQIIWEIIPEISSSIIPKRNIPESSSEEEKVAAMGNWRSMRMDMISESVKQSQNCLHRGVRELGCYLLTPTQPSFFFFLASRHGTQDLSSPNQEWNSCPPAVEVQSLNHWTIREAPIPHFWGLFLARTGEFRVCSQMPSRMY